MQYYYSLPAKFNLNFGLFAHYVLCIQFLFTSAFSTNYCTFQTPNSNVLYEIDGENTEASRYFGLNRVNGELRVIQALNTDPTASPTYNVRLNSHLFILRETEGYSFGPTVCPLFYTLRL